MDSADQAQVLEDQERFMALKARVQLSPQKIDLRRAAHCRDCGDRIATDRLRALPSAQRCAECERAFERRRRLGL